MYDGPQWRERHVEELVLGGGHHLRVRSTYQLDIPDDWFTGLLAPAKTVNVLLPVATREKRPLLAFDVMTSSGAPAHLVPRSVVAPIEQAYLELVAERLGVSALCAGISPDLLTSICHFSPGIFESFVRLHDTHALLAYLQKGLPEVPVTLQAVASWLEVIAEPAQTLVDALNEPAPRLSSSENVLLALPDLEDRPRSTGDVEAILEKYAAAVSAIADAGAHGFLVQLAEYGRRYELLVEVAVPVGVPSTITIAEDRPLRTGLNPERWWWPAGRSVQLYGLKDASSAHLEIRVTDHALRIKDAVLREPLGSEVPFGSIEATRVTAETVSFYSSVDTRSDIVHVELRIGATLGLVTTSWGLVVLVIASSVLAWTLDDLGSSEREAYLAELALLAVPTTLAATLVLTRDQTALAARLLRVPRTALIVMTASLWLIVMAKLAGETS